ncbi:hypothetical protein HIM_06487 [Hirsutella minnesotensis 3608]|uniref:Uncharacterized protein n=1 Tax=Hirsutella minnesotensis 3608 TaxID=1043627 RepID=A0A0F7ZU08_9HYPO|nr:hypothetical protein HIM_06487 [Hirsutella minnesotensis 3608]
MPRCFIRGRREEWSRAMETLAIPGHGVEGPRQTTSYCWHGKNHASRPRVHYPPSVVVVGDCGDRKRVYGGSHGLEPTEFFMQGTRDELGTKVRTESRWTKQGLQGEAEWAQEKGRNQPIGGAMVSAHRQDAMGPWLELCLLS